ncbi:M57 family metalloprotease [Pyxidicoccus parkwayensis]|uniref:M57 family metalloprotease n=1 Tax=Pyxidicoccus parkwayensis TaxID=2813578 RepID=UPI001F50DDE5|nr:M57 family metalloprotease [Pyxidicoccus parkwaysis]
MNPIRKNKTRSLVALAACSALAFGCGEQPTDPQEIVDNLLQAGFPADDIRVVGDAVYVGRDAEVSLEASREMLQAPASSEEQYRTTNTVSATVTKICVNGPGFTGVFSTALDLAIQNYEELPLTFSMARAPSSGCSYTINAVIDPNLNGGVAGFPSGGLPYSTITIGGQLSQYGVDTIEHVITHELGHTIGFRHADYYNRAISCGSGGNEGDAGVGAILIPGTPSTAAVGGSYMNSCFRASETGEMTGSDLTAVLAMYGSAPTTLSFRTATGNYLVAENGGGAYVAANRTAIGPWERFVYVDVNGGQLLNNDIINLRAADGSFVVAENGGGGVVNANRPVAGAWEAFRIINLDGWNDFLSGDRVALQAANGQYVVAENGGGGAGSGSVNANRSSIGAWETFVITLQ